MVNVSPEESGRKGISGAVEGWHGLDSWSQAFKTARHYHYPYIGRQMRENGAFYWLYPANLSSVTLLGLVDGAEMFSHTITKWFVGRCLLFKESIYPGCHIVHHAIFNVILHKALSNSS